MRSGMHKKKPPNLSGFSEKLETTTTLALAGEMEDPE